MELSPHVLPNTSGGSEGSGAEQLVNGYASDNSEGVLSKSASQNTLQSSQGNWGWFDELNNSPSMDDICSWEERPFEDGQHERQESDDDSTFSNSNNSIV